MEVKLHTFQTSLLNGRDQWARHRQICSLEKELMVLVSVGEDMILKGEMKMPLSKNCDYIVSKLTNCHQWKIQI
jgi:hypothetical protein